MCCVAMRKQVKGGQLSRRDTAIVNLASTLSRSATVGPPNCRQYVKGKTLNKCAPRLPRTSSSRTAGERQLSSNRICHAEPAVFHAPSNGLPGVFFARSPLLPWTQTPVSSSIISTNDVSLGRLGSLPSIVTVAKPPHHRMNDQERSLTEERYSDVIRTEAGRLRRL
nr:hypothetical protein CFP56_25764 [Quercus suber]